MFISRNQQLAKICKIVLVNKFTTYTSYIAFNVQFNIQAFFLMHFNFKKWRFSSFFLQSSFYGDSLSLKISTTSRSFFKKRRIINELTRGGYISYRTQSHSNDITIIKFKPSQELTTYRHFCPVYDETVMRRHASMVRNIVRHRPNEAFPESVYHIFLVDPVPGGRFENYTLAQSLTAQR